MLKKKAKGAAEAAVEAEAETVEIAAVEAATVVTEAIEDRIVEIEGTGTAVIAGLLPRIEMEIAQTARIKNFEIEKFVRAVAAAECGAGKPLPRKAASQRLFFASEI